MAAPLRFWFRRLLALGLFLGLLGAGLVFLLPQFKLQAIDIEGAYYLPKADLETASEAFLGKAIPMVLASGALKKALYAEYPIIDELKLHFSWPSALRITVNEKRPTMVIKGDRRSYLIASDGTNLSYFIESDPQDHDAQLLVIQGLPEAQVVTPKLSRDLSVKLLQVFSSIQTYIPEMDVQLMMTSPGGVWNPDDIQHLALLKDDSLMILLGKPEKLGQKIRSLRYYMRYAMPNVVSGEDQVDYIDLRLPGKVFVKYAKR